MSRLPDLQSAIRRIAGVASATVRWPDPHGPATLRVEFAAGADRNAVTEEVLAALRDVAGIDPDDLRLEAGPAEEERPVPEPTGGEPEPEQVRPLGEQRGWPPQPQDPQPRPTQPPPARERPVFQALTVERGTLDTSVEVTLAVGDHALTGRAGSLTSRRASSRAAAQATLEALRDLVPDDARVDVEWLDVLDATEPGRPAIVQVAVLCLTTQGEEVYVGSAIVRTDHREAAVRATLDALNRRLFRWNEESLAASA